jgi:hypothetical protein
VNHPGSSRQTFNKWHYADCECSIGRSICKICECRLPTTWRNYRVAAPVNTAFALTWRLSIIIKTMSKKQLRPIHPGEVLLEGEVSQQA